MPNWVEQELAVYGPGPEIDRFCALAVAGDFRRGHTLEDEPIFRFSTVCPVRRGERRACREEPAAGALFRFLRTDVQAHFSIQTAWDIPGHFYRVRLPRDWPQLSFCCAVNEDMGSFGGLLAGLGGEVIDAVAHYEGGYDRAAHRRQGRAVQKQWEALIGAGRLWRATRPLEFRSRVVCRGDAVFDDLGWRFRFRTEAECRRFAKRYTGTTIDRRVGRTWKRARAR